MLPMPEIAPLVFDESLYARAAELTTRPTAAQYIQVPYPREAVQPGILHAVLAIFIDEDGTVARVKLQQGSLPPAYERAAMEAFANARFNPGHIGDTPVKSRLVVEVDFDAGAEPAAEAPRLVALPLKR